MSDTPTHVLYVAATSESAVEVATALEDVASTLDVHGTTADRVREFLEEQPIDCVVSAYDLEDTDGISLLADVANSFPSVRTVLFSAQSSVELVRETYDAGVDEFVHDTGVEQLDVLAHRIADHASGLAIDRQPGMTFHHLQTVAETARDAIIVIDVDSTVRFVNPAIESILGYEPTELPGESLTKLMSDEQAMRHRAGILAYLQTGEKHLDWGNVELPGRHKDGHEVPLNISFSEYRVDGDRFFTGIARDVTERRERERQLQQHELMVETVRDGVYALDDEMRFIAVNDALETMSGQSREALLGAGVTEIFDFETDERISEIQAELERDESDVVALETTLSPSGGERVPVEMRISLFPIPDGPNGQVGTVRDVTERNRREEQLTHLNETGQSLSTAQTSEEVADITVRAAQKLLDLSTTSIELYDQAENRLRPVAQTEQVDALVGDQSLFPDKEGLPWKVFVENQAVNYSDRDERTALDEADTPLESAMLFPIGRYGVFISGQTKPTTFDDSDVALANVLVAHARTAFDSVQREQAVRAQRDELSEKNERLEHLNRINEVIRDLTQSLLQASSREEIHQVVCTKFANVDPYRFAWIGEQESTGGEVVPKASAGVELGYLDDVTITVDESQTGMGPAASALETHDVQVQNDLHADPNFEAWRSAALQRGYRSCVSVPLVYRDTVYGTLNLYAGEPNVFDEMELSVLQEFGELIGYAINTLERKKALLDDTTVELEFSISDPSYQAISFAREVGGRIGFESLVQRADGSLRAFFTVADADPEDVLAFASHSPLMSDISVVDERDGTVLYEATITEMSDPATLLDYGAHLTALTATAERAELTVELPRSGNIRPFLEMFLNKYDDAELVARRELDRPIKTQEKFDSFYKGLLTSRQTEVLKTAYESGFFDWPRNATGKDLAEILDVSQPTVSRHIREGERKLFELLFEDETNE